MAIPNGIVVGGLRPSPRRHYKEFSYGIDLHRSPHSAFPLIANTRMRLNVSDITQVEAEATPQVKIFPSGQVTNNNNVF